jgi:hypothetical protein
VFAAAWQLLCNGVAILKTLIVGSNTPTMVAQKTAQGEQAEKTRIEGDVQKGDSKATGEDIST